MPQSIVGKVQNSVWQLQISSLQCEFGPGEIESIIRLFVSSLYNVFLCAALLLGQRALPPVLVPGPSSHPPFPIT